METHHIIFDPVNDMTDARNLRTYRCSKCGQVFGQMSFESSQLINMNGCPGFVVPKEPVPSPFWVNGEVSTGDPGHDGLIHDLQTILREADQYCFHDYKNKKYPMPKVALVKTLEEILTRAKNGYYDNKNI